MLRFVALFSLMGAVAACPSEEPTTCTPAAGQCPNFCQAGTGVQGEACSGPSDCGCGLACIANACTPYSGVNEGCACPNTVVADTSSGADTVTTPDTPPAETGPVTPPWDENCDKAVSGADCNPYCQAGCDEADRHCTFSANNFECRAFGDVPIDGECADGTDCAEGLSCFSLNSEPANTCRKPCINQNDCPGDRPCNLNVNFSDFSASFCGLPSVGCNPFDDAETACGPGNACYYGSQATQCSTAGVAPAGTDCYGGPFDVCEPGLHCVVECQAVCSTNDAGADEPKCSAVCTGGESLEISAENNLGVCLTETIPQTCDIWAQTGCQSGEGCYRVQGGIACLTAGTTEAGEACQFTNDCVPGAVCVNSQCQELCDAKEGATGPNACETKCQSSNNLTPVVWGFGICTDAEPADPCDFWLQDCADAGKTCYLLQNGAACLDTGGSAAVDEACSGVTDCAEGLVCSGSLCRKPCHINDFPPTGAISCTELCDLDAQSPTQTIQSIFVGSPYAYCVPL